ncbi:hypothetical protein D9M73_230270 [compost metagenome]
MLHQQANHRQVPFECGTGNRQLAIVVGNQRIGTLRQQHAHRLVVAVVAGQHQQGIALVVTQVGRQAAGKQAPEHVGVALAGTFEHLLGERSGFVIGHGGGCGLAGHREPPGIIDGPSVRQACHCGQRFRFYRADR